MRIRNEIQSHVFSPIQLDHFRWLPCSDWPIHWVRKSSLQPFRQCRGWWRLWCDRLYIRMDIGRRWWLLRHCGDHFEDRQGLYRWYTENSLFSVENVRFGQKLPIWSKMANFVINGESSRKLPIWSKMVIWSNPANLVKNDHLQKVTFGQKGSNGGHERSNHLQILVLSRCCTWKRKHPLEVASEIRLIHKCRIQILFWDVIIIHWSISFSQSAHSTVHHTGRAQAQASPERFINLKVIWGHLGSLESSESGSKTYLVRYETGDSPSLWSRDWFLRLIRAEGLRSLPGRFVGLRFIKSVTIGASESDAKTSSSGEDTKLSS